MVWTSGIRMFAALLFALTCAATALSAATINVTSTADTGPDAPPPGTLRAALASAADGDTINATGITGTITLMAGTNKSATLVVDKSVTILGPGPTNLTVDANHLSGVFRVTPGHTVTIDGLRIINGQLDSSFGLGFIGGGGIFNDRSTLTVNNCALSGNSAPNGGGIANSGATLVIGEGGSAALTVSNCTFSGNSANGGGGAIHNVSSPEGSATLTVDHSTLSGNSSDRDGGAIYNVGSGRSARLTVRNSTLNGNSAGSGGAIFNHLAGGGGGGPATVTLGNCTLTGNLAIFGGAMVNDDGDATVLACTFSGNSASFHTGGIGGDGQGGGSTKVGYTILKHGQGQNLNGDIDSLGFNLSSDDGDGHLTGTGDQINTNPLLGPLAENGGSTLTHLPMPGSPAIDRGSSDLLATLGLTTDQRGLPRLFDDPGTPNDPLGDGTDIGAVEIQQPTALNLVWTNLAGGDWNVALNWSPNFVPATNDNAIIGIPVTVTVSSPAACFGLTLGSLSSSPTLTGGGTLTLYGPSAWVNGTMSGSGRTVVEASGSLLLTSPGGVSLNSRTLENGGTVNWTGAGNIHLTSGSITNRAGALFHAQNAAQISFGGGVCRFDNAGTFRKSTSSGTTLVVSGTTFNNSGTVDIQSGTVALSGGLTSPGTVSLSPGTTNRLNGGGSATGTFTAPATALVEWIGGTFTVNSGAQLDGSGLYRLNGGSVTANTDLTVQSLELVSAFSTLGGTGAVTIASGMNWTAGSMSGGGRTIIQPGVTVNLAVPGIVSLSSRTLENGGTINWTGAGNIHMTSSSITNRAGALFHAQNAAQISFGGGVCRFDNAGTFRKSASSGTTIVIGGTTFNNSGTVDIQSGTLVFSGGLTNLGTVSLSPGTTNRLNGGGSATGTFTAPATALVEWIGGTFTVSPGAQLDGSGLYRLNGGNVTVNPDLTVQNLDLVSGSSTLGGTGVVTIASGMNWTAGTMSGGGRTIIQPGATVNLAVPGIVSLNSRTLENGGTINWTGAGNIHVTSSSITNRSGALFHAQKAAQISFGGGVCRFDNAGTFRKSASSGTTLVVGTTTFNNSGTVDIQSGTLLFNGGFTNNGAVSLSTGTTNRLVGGGSATGMFTAPAPALVEWTGGTFTLNSGAQLNGAGLYRLNGGNLIANADLTAGNLDLISGSSTLSGTGAVTVGSSMNWTAGIMSGSGRTIVASGVTLHLAVTNAVALNSRTLENGGTALWTGPGLVQITSAAITNRPGALFEAQNDARFEASGLNRFDNAGTFRKTAGTGISTVRSGMTFNNSGLVDIRIGILAANGGYTSTSNAVLQCALGGTTAGTGHGQLQVAGAVTLNGALQVDFVNGYVPATNDAFAVLTAGTRNGTFAGFNYPSNAVTMQLSNTPNSVIARVTGLVSPPVPAPVLTARLVGAEFQLCWSAISNAAYRVEFSPDLSTTNWTTFPANITATNTIACFVDSLTASNRFYRVHTLP